MEIIAQALARQASLIAELDELAVFIRIAGKLQNQPEAEAEVAAPIQPAAASPEGSNGAAAPAGKKKPAQPPAAAPEPAAKQTRKPRSNGIQAKTIEAVEAILEKSAEPLPTKALLEQLDGRGVPVVGKNARAVLHARLHKVPSLIYQRPDGWRLSSAKSAGLL